MGFFDAVSSMFASSAATQAAEENQESQNEWQSHENEKDRNWQDAQWSKQFEATNAEWLKRFNLENQYNSPSQVIARLQAAGINPAAALSQLGGQGGLAAAGGSSSPSSPAPMGSHTTTPGAGYVPFGSTLSQMGESVASIVSALAQSKKVGLEEKYQNATLESIVKKLNADAEQSESAANYNNVLTFLKTYRFDERIDAEITKTWNEAAELAARKEYHEASKILQDSLTNLNNSKDKALKKVYPIYANMIESQIKVYDSQVVLNRASAAQANANTSYLASLTKTIDGLRQGQIEGQELANTTTSIVNELRARENYRDLMTSDGQIMMFAKQLEQQGYITQSALEKLRQDTNEANWWGVKFFFDCAESATRSFANVKNPINIQQRNEIQREFNEAYASGQHGSSSEVRYKDKKGALHIEKDW